MRLVDDVIKSMIGEDVVARNPVTGDEWRGRAIGYSERPVIMLESDSGFRVMLPAVWFAFAPDTDDSKEADRG